MVLVLVFRPAVLLARYSGRSPAFITTPGGKIPARSRETLATRDQLVPKVRPVRRATLVRLDQLVPKVLPGLRVLTVLPALPVRQDPKAFRVTQDPLDRLALRVLPAPLAQTEHRALRDLRDRRETRATPEQTEPPVPRDPQVPRETRATQALKDQPDRLEPMALMEHQALKDQPDRLEPMEQTEPQVQPALRDRLDPKATPARRVPQAQQDRQAPLEPMVLKALPDLRVLPVRPGRVERSGSPALVHRTQQR